MPMKSTGAVLVIIPYAKLKADGFVKSPFSALLVKSPFSALRCILRHCGVAISTPLSSGFARLETEAFYFAVYGDGGFQNEQTVSENTAIYET